MRRRLGGGWDWRRLLAFEPGWGSLFSVRSVVHHIRAHFANRRELRAKRVMLLLVLLSAGGAGVYLLHSFQVRRHAADLLAHVDRCEQAGDEDGADRYLGQYVRLAPGDMEAQARWALSRRRRAVTPKAKLEAAFLLERIVVRDPERDDVRLALAQILLEVGRFGDAVPQIVELQKRSPEDPAIARLLIQAEMGRSKHAEAVAACRKAIQLDPDDIGTYLVLAELLCDRLEKPADVDPVMDELVETHPWSADAYLARARYRLKYHDRELGRADVDKAVEIAPEHVGALQLAAEIATDDGDFAAAREFLAKALALNPGEAGLYLSLCNIDMAEDHLSNAIDTIRRGMQKSDDVRLTLTLADLLTRDGQRDEVTRVIEQLASAGLATPAVSYLRAGLFREQGEYLQAARSYEQLIGQLGDLPDLEVQAEYFLAECYRVMGLSDQACVQFRRVMRLRPRWSQPRWSVAGELAANGRFREALAECELARRVGPLTAKQCALYLRMLIWQQALRPAAQRSWESCDQLRQQGLHAWPESPEVLSAAADLFRAQGKPQDAVECLAEAARRHPQARDIRIALAVVYDRVGRAEDARGTLDETERDLGDSVALRLARASRLEEGDSSAESLRALAAADQQFPSAERVTLLRGLGLAASRLGQRELARQYLEELAKLADYDLGARLSLFDLALHTKNDAALQRSVEEMRAIEGPHGAVWRVAEASRLMAAAQASGGKASARAHDLLKEARALRPSWAKVHLTIARLADMQNEPDRAIEEYQSAVELGEHRPEVLSRLVQLLASRGRYADANRALRQMEENAPIPVAMQPIAAHVFARSRDYEAAAEQARRHVAAQPKEYRNHVWLGQLLNLTGRRDEAEAALRQAPRVAPTEIGAWVPLVLFLSRRDRLDDARAVIDQAAAGLPADRADRGLAACYEVIGDLKQAEQHFEAAVMAHPDDRAVLQAAADFYARQSRWRDAETLLRRAYELEPQDATVRRGLAMVLGSKRDYPRWQEAMKLIETNLKDRNASNNDRRVKAILLADRSATRFQREAITLLEELLKQAAATPNDRHVLAQLYYARDETSKARELMLGLIAEFPDNREYLTTYVQALLERRNSREAQGWLERLEKLDRTSLATLSLKVRLLAAQDYGAEAVQLLEQRTDELVTSGDNLSQLIEVARMYESIGQSDAAGDVYRRCRSLKPEGALLLSNWLAQQGRIGEALDVCDEAWEKLSAERVAMPSVLLIRSAQPSAEQQRRVESHLSAALAQNPESIRVRLAMAVLRDDQMRYADAVSLYKAVLECDPHNLMALNNSAWLLAQAQGNPSAALSLIEKAIEHHGETADLLDTRGVILTALGQTSRAVTDLEEAHANSPQVPIAFHLAQAYLKAGHKDRARELFRTLRNSDAVLSQLHSTERASYQNLGTALNQGSSKQ